MVDRAASPEENKHMTGLPLVQSLKLSWNMFVCQSLFGDKQPLQMCWYEQLSITSVPDPGRNVLMLMVLPGAGNWASMIALIKGWTRAGDRALRLSTSSNTYNTHKHKLHTLSSSSYVSLLLLWGVYLGEQVETAEMTNNAVDLWQAFTFPTRLKKTGIWEIHLKK